VHIDQTRHQNPPATVNLFLALTVGHSDWVTGDPLDRGAPNENIRGRR